MKFIALKRKRIAIRTIISNLAILKILNHISDNCILKREINHRRMVTFIVCMQAKA